MITAPQGFSLANTLDSGQIFRYWEAPEEGKDAFIINQRSDFFLVKQRKTAIITLGTTDTFLQQFFSFKREPAWQDSILDRAKKSTGTLTILQQDPWQCLVSFLLSQNSNIPRIRGNIEALSQAYGKKKKVFGRTFFTFPEPGALQTPYTACKLGYRAVYLAKLNAMINNFELESLRHLPYCDAKRTLLTLPGVGEKVADCVLLFSLGFRESFPVDVHIRRVMEEEYFQGKKTNPQQIRLFAQKSFGHQAGLAQQYLFHYARTKKQTHF